MKMKEKFILNDHKKDGLDRRGFLECMAWAGTGMLWSVSGGLLASALLLSRAGAAVWGQRGHQPQRFRKFWRTAAGLRHSRAPEPIHVVNSIA
jgi:hypothetical protein